MTVLCFSVTVIADQSGATVVLKIWYVSTGLQTTDGISSEYTRIWNSLVELREYSVCVYTASTKALDCRETEVFGPTVWGAQWGMIAGNTTRMGTSTQATSGLANGSGLIGVPMNRGQFINSVIGDTTGTGTLWTMKGTRVQERRDVGEDWEGGRASEGQVAGQTAFRARIFSHLTLTLEGVTWISYCELRIHFD